MYPIIKLIRVKQWVKNLFLFIPVFFAGNLFHTPQLNALLLGVLAFSLAASGVYVINDYRDRELDRLHPRKKNRPLASGAVSSVIAWILMISLTGGGLLLAAFIEIVFFYWLLAYLIINLGYSMGLKNVPILDLFIVASGFLIRVHCGGIIAHVEITHWLYIMIMLLALFIVTAKRRDDLLIQSETGEVVRKASRSYNLEFINSCLTLISAVVIVAYIMYTVSPEVTEHFKSKYLFSTTIFVIAGIMRYLQITFVEQDSGSPTSVLFKDKFILVTVLGWITSFYFIIYAKNFFL
jgi:4-hydroxybenzoate polyprenyltransferase